jgi:hypothetical protein
MTPEETKQVLAKAAFTDHRTVDIQSIRVWHEIIGHLDYPDALDALTLHRRESAEYLQPVHIITGARRVRADRARDAGKQRALTAAPPKPDLTEPQLRRRIFNSPEFRAEFENGRVQGNADRAYQTELRNTGDRRKAVQAAQASRDAARAARQADR